VRLWQRTAKPGSDTATTTATAPLWRADERLRRLEWSVLKRLDGILQGDWRTLFRGHGLDLADLREYQPHDDVRRIDWAVTARTGTPFVREYLEDREAVAWFLLDLSPSVDFGTRARKRSVAADFTGVMASALTRKGHRVGAVMYGQGVDTTMPARSGRAHVMALMENIERRPNLQLVGSKKPGAKACAGAITQLDALLGSAQTLMKGRCCVFVVSDFISKPGWEAPLAELARRHDVVAVRVVDPAEREMPDVGLVPLVDAETGDSLMVDTGSPRFRKRYAEASAQREAKVREALASAGVDALELLTSDDLGDALLRFVHARKSRARLNAGATRASLVRRATGVSPLS
jgi:uncharacterized protein (DUF58 family)